MSMDPLVCPLNHQTLSGDGWAVQTTCAVLCLGDAVSKEQSCDL